MHRPLSVAVLLALCLSATACNPRGDTGAEHRVEQHGVADSNTPDTDTCVLDPPEQPHVCTMEWDPVCGCNGKTYGNACTARGAGVPRTTPGACEDTSQ